MKLLLFLGSGISFASGLPNADKITSMLLEDYWYKHTDQTFSYGQHPNEADRPYQYVDRLQEFLVMLQDSANSYLINRKRPQATYEDIFYLAQQISDDLDWEIDNPAITPFIEQIKDDTTHLCDPIPTIPKIDLSFLASESCKLIQCVVWSALYKESAPVGIDLIKKLALDSRVDRLDIGTLNHDLLVESLLSEASADFVDGFGDPQGEVRFFDQNVYLDQEIKIKLFKLHGSINWHRYRETQDDIEIDRYGIPTNKDLHHSKSPTGDFYRNLTYQPMFLTGSYNKILDYGFGIYREVHIKFHEALKDQRIMVVSGYGWNDKVVNGWLLEWLMSSMGNRLILFHRRAETEIKKRSKSAMWHRFDPLVKDGRLIPVSKWLSETSMDELFTLLNRL